MNTSSPSSEKPGRVISLLLDATTREVEVQHVEEIGVHFRAITLGGQQLRGQRWSPGDMVQLILSGATFFGSWELRSYTPFAFDPDSGTMQVLGVVHGNGPGSDWLASAEAGTRCRLVGPRFALSLPKERPLVFFGDETSFSTAAALRTTSESYGDVRLIFEVNSLEDSGQVVERFGMGDSIKLVQRQEDDGHLDELEREVLSAYRSGQVAHGVLTGKAPSIQRIYKALKASGVPGRKLTNVAYWAPGRKGLKGR